MVTWSAAFCTFAWASFCHTSKRVSVKLIASEVSQSTEAASVKTRPWNELILFYLTYGYWKNSQSEIIFQIFKASIKSSIIYNYS